MGILGLQFYLESNPAISRRIDIRKLVEKDTRQVIVVDGEAFIASYAKMPCIIGEVTKFVDNVRDFVKAFERLSVKLVFFFQMKEFKEQNLDVWMHASKKKCKCSRIILEDVREEKSVLYLRILPENQMLWPFDITYWTISLLRELKCEVICLIKDLVWNMAHYARENNCLAIMSQNTYFVAFQKLNSLFLSLKHFDIKRMTTKVYDRDALASRLHFNKKFFPLLATLLGTTEEINGCVRKEIMEIIRSRVFRAQHAIWCIVTATYIREYFSSHEFEDICTLLTQHFPNHSKILIEKYSEHEALFSLKNGNSKFSSEENFLFGHSGLNQWEKIKVKCRELYKCGKVSEIIFSVIEKQMYEQSTTLEDHRIRYNFLGLNISSIIIYRTLRQNMYGILLHEAMNLVDYIEVQEWCSKEKDSRERPVMVLPTSIKTGYHPGLLNLWDNTQNEDLSDKKWRLFARAVSPNLNYDSLRNLPESLVIPVAVLYYLCQEVPKFSSFTIEFWEIEVFLGVALILPHCDEDFLRNLDIRKVNVRAIKLSALFVHGCDIMKTVVQACGFVMNENYSCIWHFFEGKLFHNKYELARTGSVMLDPMSGLCCELNSIMETIFIPQD